MTILEYITCLVNRDVCNSSDQGRIYLMRGPRLIHLRGPLTHCCEKNGKR